MLKRCFTGVLVLCSCCVVYAQQGGGAKALLRLTQHADSLVNQNGAEKLYIQFDKPYYAVSDTIWLKGYLLNEATYDLSSRSGLLHIDLANDSNKVVKQYLFPVLQGLVSGKIALDDKVFKSGDYTLRAYTNWMRNFDGESFFYKTIRVTETGENTWLINKNVKTIGQDTRLQLQVMDLNKQTLADSALNVTLVNGKKTLFKQNVQSDNNGLVDLKFAFPAAASRSELIIQNKSRTKKAIIPIALDRPENTDIQFMPEGGGLLAGFSTRIGFKAIGEDGRGVNISGNIIDQKDSVVASFKALHNGIGSFYLQPQTGESYTAKLNLPGGTVKSYPLPIVKASGTFLKVKDISGADSLEVTIAATPDLANAHYYLIAKARTIVCYAAVADLAKEPFMRTRVAKSKFPSGITHIILTNAQGHPLNERLVYIDHQDGLRFDIKPEHQTYNPKDSVALRIKITDKDGYPITGNFSMAVTDDGQVKADSSGNDNILSRMLLTSDLKGYVEEPGYYLKDNDASRQALDNLLLTQGWVNYDPPVGKIRFEAETEFKIHGRLNNIFNKGLQKTEVVLLSTRPQIVMDTVTGKDGRFTFDRFPRVDTPVFILKSNKRNFNVNIDVEEISPPVFAPPASPAILPWYVNADSILLKFVKSSAQMQLLQYYPGGGRVLREVKITAKKIVKNSYNPNGAGEADVVMDEKDLEAAGKKTWAQLCEEKIPGFHEEIMYHRAFHPHYEVFKRYVILIVNGEMMSRAINKFDIVQFLNFHTAEDIKGIEAITSSKYIYRYIREFFPSQMIDPEIIAFVEITTRSGEFKMPFTPGTYLYKPLAITWPKQFYKPKYTIRDTTNLTDLRSTIDWEPSISTDKNGEATVWFYAAGTPSTYSIIIEGVDGNGLLGYKRQKLLIAKPKSAIGK